MYGAATFLLSISASMLSPFCTKAIYVLYMAKLMNKKLKSSDTLILVLEVSEDLYDVFIIVQ